MPAKNREKSAVVKIPAEPRLKKDIKKKKLNRLLEVSKMLQSIVQQEDLDHDMEEVARENIKVLSTLAMHSIAAIENVMGYEEARKLMFIDALTGVHNYRYFKERIEEEFERAKRHHFELCLLFVDIDGFKKFNDTYGHMLGNEVLKSYARILIKGIRAIDVVFRYGGDEFAVLLPQTDLLGGEIVAKRVQDFILSYNQKEKYRFSELSVSIGIAALSQKMKSVKVLINNADKAMYRAKRNRKGKGKNKSRLGALALKKRRIEKACR